MKLSVAIAVAGCALLFVAPSSVEAIINTRGPRLYHYSEARLLAVNARAGQFVLQGRKDPSERLTLFVSPTSRFFRDGAPLKLQEAKIGEDVSGSFIIAVDRKATAVETTFAPATPVRKGPAEQNSWRR
ncbi:MAG: hypothetical protein H0U88_03505 [Chthoniobacterales bacterium]|nr:hypothetical protein [Chthoniobacterales bacterium]